MYWFAASKETSTMKLPQFFLKFKKTMRDLRVNENKVTSRKVFIVNPFTLES